MPNSHGKSSPLKFALLSAGLLSLAACDAARPITATAPGRTTVASPTNQADPRNRRWSEGRLPSYRNSGASQRRAAANSNAPVRVGLLLPLSGPYAAYGKSLADAAALALFDARINREIEILPRDTQATAEGAAAAAVDALSAGATVLIGPVTSTGAIAAARATAGSGTPLLLLTSDHTAAEPGVFAAGHAPQAAATRIVDYAVQQGVRAIAGVALDDAAGRAALAGMQAAAAARGVRVAGQAALPAQASGDARRATLASALQSLRGDGALFLPFPAEALRTLNADLSAIMSSPAPLLGAPEWDGANLAALPAFARASYAGYDPRLTGSFRQRYQSAYGRPPARGAALVYDLTATVALAAQSARGAGLGSHDLTVAGGFQGVQGPFRLTRDGAALRRYAIIGMRNGRLEIIEPANSNGS